MKQAQDNPNTTWNKITSCIKIVAKNVLGESRGGTPPCKDISWWNEEVKAAIKIKRNSYRDLKKNYDGVSFEKYNLAKKEAKKAVQCWNLLLMKTFVMLCHLELYHKPIQEFFMIKTSQRELLMICFVMIK